MRKWPGQFIALRPICSPSALDEEHVLAVVLPVPGRLPQRLVEDDRRLDLDVAGRDQHARACSRRACSRASCPSPSQNVAPGAHGWNMNSPSSLADLAVVALLGFLDPLQVRLQIRLAEERGAVDALHRLVARVALPVRVRRAQQLERLQPAGRRHVRADAEVDERVAILDRVAGDLGLARGLLLDQLHLERLALLREELAAPRRAATSAARRRDPAPPAPSSSSRSPRGPPARTADRRRSRRRTLRRSPGRCRTACRETAS